MPVYYNEIDPFCCEVLRANIRKGRLPEGDVDERDIRDVQPGELLGYRQIHLFAGIGGFALGLRWAGIPDDFSVITGGFPCQDVSCAGKGEGIGTEDDPTSRSGLWWEMRRIIAGVRPAFVLIENVPALRTKGADAVLVALEEIGYAVAPLVVGAWAVGSPQQRDRVWIVAHATINRMEAGTERERRQTRPNACRCGQGTGLVNPDGFGFQSPGASGEVAGTARTSEADSEEWQRDGNAASDSSEARRMAHSDGFGCELDAVSLHENNDHSGADGTGEGNSLGDHETKLADAQGVGPQGMRADWQRGTGSPIGTRLSGGDGYSGGTRWPARPGQPQHEWEEPRTIKSGVGSAVARLSVGLDGYRPELEDERPGVSYRRIAIPSLRRESLKALGNAVVPQVVEAIGRAILEFEGDL